MGRLVLADLAVGPLHVDRLELEVTDLGTDPGERGRRAVPAPAHAAARARDQASRRPRSTSASSRCAASSRASASRNVQARLGDGYVSRARARRRWARRGGPLVAHPARAAPARTCARSRATSACTAICRRPGPVLADRVLAALLGATDAAGVAERPHARGLCDVEIDLIGALLWHLMPPAGWRLPAVAEIELVAA